MPPQVRVPRQVALVRDTKPSIRGWALQPTNGPLAWMLRPIDEFAGLPNSA